MTQVLAELKEYATEVDVDFVRKAVRAIGRCAIKVEVKERKKKKRTLIQCEQVCVFFFYPVADIVLLLQQSAERCVSTLLDLIQTKVNYVVQEAIVVIRDIFRKYPNKCVSSTHHNSDGIVSPEFVCKVGFRWCVCVFFRYESIIATLCENLDSLDEPDARAAMIWIVGEYAERIDNADELLESFLEGFHDESTQVGLAPPAGKGLA